MSPKNQPELTQNPRYRWISPISVLCLLAVIFCWLMLSISVFNDYKRARALRDRHRENLSQIDQEIAQLEEQKEQFELGAEEKERVIRERYKMVREGERMIQIIPPSQ